MQPVYAARDVWPSSGGYPNVRGSACSTGPMTERRVDCGRGAGN